MATSFSSVGVEYVSTRPVVIVTSLIHRSSRCSVAGRRGRRCSPRTPGRTSAAASSKVGRDADGLDGDVGTEPIGQLGEDLGRILTVVVDDDVGAEALGGVEAGVRRSIATMWAGL